MGRPCQNDGGGTNFLQSRAPGCKNRVMVSLAKMSAAGDGQLAKNDGSMTVLQWAPFLQNGAARTGASGGGLAKKNSSIACSCKIKHSGAQFCKNGGGGQPCQNDGVGPLVANISTLSKLFPCFQWFLAVSRFPETWKPETQKPSTMHQQTGHVKVLQSV